MTATGNLLELRLLLEELCCDLCRYLHSGQPGENPDEMEIHREVALGEGKGFADIVVQPRPAPTYFVEVKFGYGDDDVLDSLRRKYAGSLPAKFGRASKVILVLDRAERPGFDRVVERIRAEFGPDLALEVWDEEAFAG